MHNKSSKFAYHKDAMQRYFKTLRSDKAWSIKKGNLSLIYCTKTASKSYLKIEIEKKLAKLLFSSTVGESIIGTNI